MQIKSSGLQVPAFGFIEGWKRLELKHITFTSPDLPPYFDGYRLVQITDFHLGSFPPGNDFVQKVVDATNNEEPDMILFTGDLVNNQASEVEPYLDTLRQLHASDGIYSIWGNHDYCEYGNNHSIGALKRNRRMLYGYQESLGWHQLMNEHHVVSHGMASIAVLRRLIHCNLRQRSLPSCLAYLYFARRCYLYKW